MTVDQQKASITQKFRNGEISADEMLEQMKKLDRKPPRFAVAATSGWLSIYFDGMRFPVSMPSEMAEILFSDDQVKAARQFLADNKSRFKTKEDRKK